MKDLEATRTELRALDDAMGLDEAVERECLAAATAERRRIVAALEAGGHRAAAALVAATAGPCRKCGKSVAQADTYGTSIGACSLECENELGEQKAQEFRRLHGFDSPPRSGS